MELPAGGPRGAAWRPDPEKLDDWVHCIRFWEVEPKIDEANRENWLRHIYWVSRSGKHAGNGLAIWELIAELYQQGRPIPSDLHEKLAHWAYAVRSAQNPRQMLQALELAGDKKKKVGPARYALMKARYKLANEVHQLTKPPVCWNAAKAIAHVAREHGLPIFEVKRELYAMRRLKPPKPDRA